MKRLRVLVSLCALLLAAAPALAHPVFSYPVADSDERQRQLQELAQALRAQSEVRGAFVQTKHLSVLSQPIESTGRFALADDGQFQWDIRTPFQLSYTYTGDTLVRTQDGQKDTLKAADEPTLYGFFSFISSIFQLTERELSKHFTRFYQHQQDSENWTLGLRPKDDRLRTTLSELVVIGRGVRIEQAILIEPNGDRTELQFHYPDVSSPGTER